MHAGDPERDRRNCRGEAEKDGAEGSEHEIKPATISLLTQLRKYATVPRSACRAAPGRLQR
jgi:hypothetical protein